MGRIAGDLLILGVAGKMGPSLARLARRASDLAGTPRRVIGVARFGDPAARGLLESAGVETIAGDLLDPAVLAALPEAPNVLHLAGQKFGTSGEADRTWAVNAWLAGAVAERFRDARIVALSTGNVYPFSAADGAGPTEDDPVGPVGEYAQSALARERLFTFFSRRHGTPVALLRLNYAIEPRYGVLRDLADRLLAGRPIDLGAGMVNVIWQRDANAIALHALEHVASPPLVLNVTGRPAHPVAWLAAELGRRLDVTPSFTGTAPATALLSDASRMERLFGAPPVSIEEMLDAVALWVGAGGRSLAKPTHFEEREGRF